MSGLRSTALCAVLAPLFLSGVASAQPFLPVQDLPFEVVASGSPGNQGAAGERVITSASKLKAFVGDVLPSSVGIAYGNKKGDAVVLAIRRNDQKASSTLEITKITLGFEGGMVAYVDYAEKPPAGPFSLPAIVDKFVAVKVKRPADGFKRFVFRKSAESFDEVTLRNVTKVMMPPTTTNVVKSITVRADGSATVSDMGGPAIGGKPPVHGQLSPADLAELQKVWKAAKVASLPADVTQVVHIVAPWSTFTVESSFGGGSKTFGGEPGIYKDTLKARVKPLVDLLNKLLDKVLDQANEIQVTGRVGVNGGTVTVTPMVGIVPPGIHITPAISWRVANEPFYSMLKAAKDKRVTIIGKRIPGFEPVVKVSQVLGDNEKAVDVRDAQGKKIGSIAANNGVTVTGVKGLNYEIEFNGGVAFVKKSAIEIGSTNFPMFSPAPTPGIIGGITTPD